MICSLLYCPDHRVGTPPAGGYLLCAPGRAHSLGGVSLLHTRKGEALAER